MVYILDHFYANRKLNWKFEKLNFLKITKIINLIKIRIGYALMNRKGILFVDA